MEQNKYIPGDWVIDKMDLSQGYVQIKQISETFGKETLILKSGRAVNFSEVEPIPLTPEILEKNGWEKVTYSSSKGQSTLLAKDFDDDVSRITVAFYKQVIKAKVWHNGYILGIYLSDVHQLQHLLFGLGLDSNFNLKDIKKVGEKITRKEINLRGIFNKHFGTMYKTRDGRKAVLVNTSDVINHHSELYVQEGGIEDFGNHMYAPNGKCLDGNSSLDIIGLLN